MGNPRGTTRDDRDKPSPTAPAEQKQATAEQVCRAARIRAIKDTRRKLLGSLSHSVGKISETDTMDLGEMELSSLIDSEISELDKEWEARHMRLKGAGSDAEYAAITDDMLHRLDFLSRSVGGNLDLMEATSSKDKIMKGVIFAKLRKTTRGVLRVIGMVMDDFKYQDLKLAMSRALNMKEGENLAFEDIYPTFAEYLSEPETPDELRRSLWVIISLNFTIKQQKEFCAYYLRGRTPQEAQKFVEEAACTGISPGVLEYAAQEVRGSIQQYIKQNIERFAEQYRAIEKRYEDEGVYLSKDSDRGEILTRFTGKGILRLLAMVVGSVTIFANVFANLFNKGRFQPLGIAAKGILKNIPVWASVAGIKWAVKNKPEEFTEDEQLAAYQMVRVFGKREGFGRLFQGPRGAKALADFVTKTQQDLDKPRVRAEALNMNAFITFLTTQPEKDRDDQLIEQVRSLQASVDGAEKKFQQVAWAFQLFGVGGEEVSEQLTKAIRVGEAREIIDPPDPTTPTVEEETA